MTVSALKLLQNGDDASRGFFLLIEGGRIDHVSLLPGKSYAEEKAYYVKIWQ